MKKWWMGGLMAAALVAAMTTTAWAAEWQEDESGWWYMEDDGTYPADEWRLIDGKYYCFGADGYMLADTITPDSYAVGPDGVRIVDDTALAFRNGNYTVYQTEGQTEWEGPADSFSVQRLDEKSYRVNDGESFSGVFYRTGRNSFQCEKYIQSARYMFSISFVGDDSVRITQLDMVSRLPSVKYYQK